MFKDMCPAPHRYPHIGLVFGQSAELACCLVEVIEGRNADVVRVVVIRNFDVIIFLGGNSDDVWHWDMLSHDMPDIEINTTRYEREHGQKPTGRRFWYFVLVSDTITVKDHFLNLDDKQRTYPDALEEAKRVATLRKSVRIIVEP